MTACKSCGAPITWATSAAGKAMPLQIDEKGLWVIVQSVARLAKVGDSGPLYSSHFSSCPQAAQWRRS